MYKYVDLGKIQQFEVLSEFMQMYPCGEELGMTDSVGRFSALVFNNSIKLRAMVRQWLEGGLGR